MMTKLLRNKVREDINNEKYVLMEGFQVIWFELNGSDTQTRDDKRKKTLFDSYILLGLRYVKYWQHYNPLILKTK